jgi:NTE family protein
MGWMIMGQKLALVFGGGGARGALQVGAVRALIESGCQPDLLVGTSVGAINAAFLALNGVSMQGVDKLTYAWQQAAEQDLLPANYIRMSLQAILRRSSLSPAAHIRDFFIASGITPDIRFAEFQHPSLIIVSSDLNTGKPVLHGEILEDSVLDAMLVSTALPPWTMPVRKKERYLMDGAVVSSLPIEPALRAGATSIIALDLIDAREPFGQVSGFGIFFNQLTYAVEQRQGDLELALAKARGVPVFYMRLTSGDLVHIWDFGHTQELIARGYEIAVEAIRQHHAADDAPASSLLPA